MHPVIPGHRVGMDPEPRETGNQTQQWPAPPRDDVVDALWLGPARQQTEVGMAELYFYHLQNKTLEQALPSLLDKTLARGWRAVVEIPDPERLSAIDDHLWTFAEDSFLPHGRLGEGDNAADPIVLCTQSDEGKGDIRFLIGGAPLPAEMDAYQRIVIMVEPSDETCLVAARAQWKTAREAGHEIAYWQEDENGRWQKRA